MNKNSKLAFEALTTDAERKEWLAAVTLQSPLKLRYLKNSKKMMGIPLWDVLSPRLPSYVYSSDSHIPTLGLEGLRQNGLIQ